MSKENIAAKAQKSETKKEKLKRMTQLWIKENDAKAFEYLMNWYYPRMKSFAFNYIKDADEIEDVLADTFMTIYQKTKDYYKEQGCQFNTWMFTICKNGCLGKIAQKNKRNELDSDISDLGDHSLFKSAFNGMLSEVNTNYTVDKATNKLSEIADKEEVLQNVYDASLNEIKKLDETSSRMIEMKFKEGLRIQDIAEHFNVNESFVKNRIYNGLKTVRKNFIKNNEDLYETYIDVKSLAS